MTEKQQQLLFDKGITNVPSDALCSDNALAESIGMVYDNGEHRVIQRPKQVYTAQGNRTLLYVHKVENTDYCIFIEGGTTYNLRYGILTQSTIESVRNLIENTGANYSPNITSVGKTLIVSDGDGIHYFLMKKNSPEATGEYIALGPIPMPEPDFQLRLYEANDKKKEDRKITNIGYLEYVHEMFGNDLPEDAYRYYEPVDVVMNSASFQGIFRTNGFNDPPNDPDDDHSGDKWPDWHQEDYNNLVLGCYSKNKKTAAEKECFCNPFFVRVALELYDGSYTHITNPVLMMAGVESNSYARVSTSWNFTLYTFVRQLMVKQNVDYTDWEDIVRDVVVFVTDEIDVHETMMDVRIYKECVGFKCRSLYATADGSEYRSKFNDFTHTDLQDCEVRHPIEHSQWIAISQIPAPYKKNLPYHYNPLVSRSESDVKESAKAASVFYKLCKIGKTKIADWVSTREKIEQHVLATLTSQETLPYDDYYSACPLKAGYVYSYNSRLNLADVHRGFFAGFNTFMPLDFSGSVKYNWYFKVTIKTESGERTVWHHVESSQMMGHYFYYPDSRAKKVSIYKGSNLVAKDLSLTEHPGLNGAYHMASIYDIDLIDSLPGGEGEPSGYTEPSAEYEYLPTYILTSQVNNPFVFLAEGYNSVGMGRVIGISSITQALSEGQFGQYPLLVFATDGIWAMSVNNTGMYSSIHPMSREVALEDNPCLTQTDGAVFFVSKKGLMVVVGNQVKCVSEQLSGRGSFNDYLKKAFIAYDYRDSLLWIFDGKSYTTQGQTRKGSNICWVYSIKSGTFGKFNFGEVQSGDDDPVPIRPINVLNYYPDYLIQTDNQNEVLSLMQRKDINDDDRYYDATMTTRPIKLENGLALKSIMQIKNIYDFMERDSEDEDKKPGIALSIFASNNFKNWVELTSLRGTPWKYYRFTYDFSNLSATDKFAGTVVVTQERRTDKLR